MRVVGRAFWAEEGQQGSGRALGSAESCVRRTLMCLKDSVLQQGAKPSSLFPGTLEDAETQSVPAGPMYRLGVCVKGLRPTCTEMLAGVSYQANTPLM